jgi:hypothetical protein
VSWQITPRVLTDAMAAGDDEAKRAFDAMMDEEGRRRCNQGGAARLSFRGGTSVMSAIGKADMTFAVRTSANDPKRTSLTWG